MPDFKTIIGDAITALQAMPESSVDCCITSPPYWGLRDYGHEGQLGLEASPEDYVAAMVAVFREVARVLKPTGTLWLNLGDSYAGASSVEGWREGAARADGEVRADGHSRRNRNGTGAVPGLKPKDMVGIPWRVAFALQADGWYLRQDIIWHKPNPMPESVKDRCTKAHEYVFLLTKSDRYFYNYEAVKEPAVTNDTRRPYGSLGANALDPRNKQGNGVQRADADGTTRNRRDVWTIPTKPFKGAHFAVMPEALVEPCLLAGCPEGGTVLDPFAGSGTVGVVAMKNGRNFLGIELNPEYAAMAENRIRNAVPAPALFNSSALAG